MRPVSVPEEGPCRDQNKKPCKLKRHSYRPRVTGPGFPILVMECEAHGVFFTVYPLGHFPYGRKPLLAVAPDGKPLQDEPAKDNEDACWLDTQFQAALDAAERKAWPREHRKPSQRWWPQQRRLLAWAMTLLGIGLEPVSRGAQRIAAALAVPLVLLKEGLEQVRARPGYHSRGKAVRGVLRKIPSDAGRLDRLLAAGHHAGLWRRPYRWDPRTRKLRALVFRPAGTGVPPPRR